MPELDFWHILFTIYIYLFNYCSFSKMSENSKIGALGLRHFDSVLNFVVKIFVM